MIDNNGFSCCKSNNPRPDNWMIVKKEWCKGRDLNSRTTKDKALNLASLAMLDYPCSKSCE